MANADHRGTSAWRVLKFGGTSVSSLVNWRNIAATARQRGDDGSAVLIVHSALSGVTDLLERAFAAAIDQGAAAELLAVRERHLSLALDLGLDAIPSFEARFSSLQSCLEVIAERGAPTARDRAAAR